jgi:DNA repair exonuclease SbcCD ATPase subunit
LFRLVSECHQWLLLRKATAALWDSVLATRSRLDVAAHALEQLEQVPSTVARRYQVTLRAAGQMSQLAQDLRAAKLHGPAFDAALGEQTRLLRLLEALPDWCRASASADVLQQANRETTVEVWQTLNDAEASIAHQQTALHGWGRALKQAHAEMRQARRSMVRARRYLAQMPQSIDTIGQTAECDELEHVIESLAAQLDAPSVQVLDSLREHAVAADAFAAGIGHLADETAGLQEVLSREIPETARRLRTLETRMADLAHAATYPVDWGGHSEELARLRAELEEMGPLDRKRSPALLHQHIEGIRRLANAGSDLDSVVSQVFARRREMVDLLRRSGLVGEPAWLARAEDIHHQATRYGSSNWPEGSAVARLADDARQLAVRHRQCAPCRPQDPLAADTLESRARQVEALTRDLGAFQDRLTSIGERLSQVQAVDRCARQQLDTVSQALGTVLGPISSSDPPYDPSVARHLRQLAQLVQQGGSLRASLRGQRARPIEETAARVVAWMKPCQRCLGRLIEAVRCDRSRAVEQLRQEIAALRELAPLDREPAMRRAIALLEIERSYAEPAIARSQVNLEAEIGQRVAALENLLADRQEIHAAIDGLRTQIKEPISAPTSALESARREALARLDALTLVAREAEAAWPPIVCDTRAAEDLLDRAQHEERNLSRSGATTSGVLTALNNALRFYKDLISEAQLREQRCREERWTLDEMVERLDEWEEQLEAYGRARRDDPAIEQAINSRLAQVARVRGREKRRSNEQPVRFEQARRVLENLWQLGHGADIPIEGQEAPISVAEIERRCQ